MLGSADSVGPACASRTACAPSGCALERAGGAVRCAVPAVLAAPGPDAARGGTPGRPRARPRRDLPDQLDGGAVVPGRCGRRTSRTATSASCTTRRPLVRLVQRLVLATVARVVLGRADAILPIDEHIAAGLAGDGARPGAAVLGNGVDTDAVPPRPGAERADPAGSACRWTGRSRCSSAATCRRRASPVVAAAAGDDYDLVFVGGDRPAGVDDPRLHFIGALPPAEMPAVYACADVMVVASVGECPLTVLEAMAAGCRCWSTTTRRCTRRGRPARACGSSTWPAASCPRRSHAGRRPRRDAPAWVPRARLRAGAVLLARPP